MKKFFCYGKNGICDNGDVYCEDDCRFFNNKGGEWIEDDEKTKEE